MGRPVNYCSTHPEKRVKGRGMCLSCYVQWHKSQNPDKYRQWKENWKLSPKYGKRSNSKRYKHGVSYSVTRCDFIEMLKAQDGKCAICKGVFERLMVDHDHSTGKIRGLLCPRCNPMLGYLESSRDVLEKAVEYLKFHGSALHLDLSVPE